MQNIILPKPKPKQQESKLGLKNLLNDKVPPRLGKVIFPVLERAMAFPSINEIYNLAGELEYSNSADFAKSILSAMGVEVEVSPHDLAKIPTKGPLVVVANHPFGGVEGIILVDLMSRARSDNKVMVNYLLGQISELDDVWIKVNPFGGSNATRSNIKGLKEAIRWLKEGHALGVFPAGTVSSLNIRKRQVRDPEWSSTIAGIIQRTEVPVLPIYFQGRNSWRFQLAGILSSKLRTMMLLREVANKRNRRFKVVIGSPISSKLLLAKGLSTTEMMDYLRLRTYSLKQRFSTNVKNTSYQSEPVINFKSQINPIRRPIAKSLIAKDIAGLAPESEIITFKKLAVYIARAPQIPNLLREIGRLREISFRNIGEGSGRSEDLDQYDQDYLQLVLWDKEKQQVAGGYRLGLTDELVKKNNCSKLYIASLYDIKKSFFTKMGPAIEMGRSFVAPEYQRHPMSLMLLWQGITRFIYLNPRYRYSFGLVSLSENYQTITQQTLVSFLSRPEFMSPLSRYIHSRKPFFANLQVVKTANELVKYVHDFSELDQAVADIESDGRRLPVLFRHYMKFHTRTLTFGVDPNFSNCLDYMCITDLLAPEPGYVSKLARYMGKKEVAEFFAYHGQTSS